MNIYGLLMDIFDLKNKDSILFHAPAQPRKGFICGNSKNKNLWEFVAH